MLNIEMLNEEKDDELTKMEERSEELLFTIPKEKTIKKGKNKMEQSLIINNVDFEQIFGDVTKNEDKPVAELKSIFQNLLTTQQSWVSEPKLFNGKIYFSIKGNEYKCAKLLRNVTGCSMKRCQKAIFADKNGHLMASFEI